MNWLIRFYSSIIYLTTLIKQIRLMIVIEPPPIILKSHSLRWPVWWLAFRRAPWWSLTTRGTTLVLLSIIECKSTTVVTVCSESTIMGCKYIVMVYIMRWSVKVDASIAILIPLIIHISLKCCLLSLHFNTIPPLLFFIITRPKITKTCWY